jgi:hypothetical protein
VDALGLPLAVAGDGGYFYSERIDAAWNGLGRGSVDV